MKNSQNDPLCASSATKKKDTEAKRLVRTRTTLFYFTPTVSMACQNWAVPAWFSLIPGVRIDEVDYRQVLLSHHLLPAIRHVFYLPGRPCTDAQTTRDHQLSGTETRAYSSHKLWPPNGPDLDPVDYKIWGLMPQRIYQNKATDFNDLKQRLIEVWAGLKQNVVDYAINQTSSCLHSSQRRTFEQLL